MRCWLGWLVCLFASGCLAFGYPSVSRTPAVAVDEPDVHAFRITSGRGFYGCLIAGCIQLDHEIETLPVVGATVKPQADCHFAYTCLLFLYAASYGREVKVVLYRPGYEAVEIPSRARWRWLDGRPVHVAWKEAPDLASQEKALAAVIGENVEVYGKMSPEVLRFAAQEHARLAHSPLAAGPEMRAKREKLRAAARHFEELAGEPAGK
jgi:hypothetical protein